MRVVAVSDADSSASLANAIPSLSNVYCPLSLFAFITYNIHSMSVCLDDGLKTHLFKQVYMLCDLLMSRWKWNFMQHMCVF